MKKREESIKLAPSEKEAVVRVLKKLTGREESSAKPTGLFCEECGKEIAEEEKYFAGESAFAHMISEEGKQVEIRDTAWQTELLCMDCYENKLEEYDERGEVTVEDHEKLVRQTNRSTSECGA